MFLLPYLLLLSSPNFEEVAKKIWINECGGNVEALVSWNIGEEFASLGIGHFIWYPKGKTGPFTEQFPEFVEFAKSKGVAVPEWCLRPSPWNSRKEFLEESEKKSELRKFLLNHFSIQAEFIEKKLDLVLPKMVAISEKKEHVEKMFHLVKESQGGLYALADYLNFKGDGTRSSERYQGQGWGLNQVLENMDDKCVCPIQEFVKQAKSLLTMRVANSPPERNEKRWLKGWLSRLDTYLE